MGRLIDGGRAIVTRCKQQPENVGKLVRLVRYFPAASPGNEYGVGFWYVEAVGLDDLLRPDGEVAKGGLFSPCNLCALDGDGGKP